MTKKGYKVVKVDTVGEPNKYRVTLDCGHIVLVEKRKRKKPPRFLGWCFECEEDRRA